MRKGCMVISGALLFLVLLIPVIKVSAWGGAGGVPHPGSPQGRDGNFPYTDGYGFRVYLHDTESDGLLWNVHGDGYSSKSNIASVLDKSASNSALYLSVGAEYKTYDEQYGNTPWIDVNTISASEFNTMPGMSGYVEPAESYTNVDFSDYANIFNQISEKADTVDGTQEIIDWFASQGVETTSYNPETTVIVVEPVAKWMYGDARFIVTYQNVREYDNTQDGCFSFFTFAPALNKNCIAEGDKLVPQKGTVGGTTAYIHGYLGAFYQACQIFHLQ